MVLLLFTVQHKMVWSSFINALPFASDFGNGHWSRIVPVWKCMCTTAFIVTEKIALLNRCSGFNLYILLQIPPKCDPKRILKCHVCKARTCRERAGCHRPLISSSFAFQPVHLSTLETTKFKVVYYRTLHKGTKTVKYPPPGSGQEETKRMWVWLDDLNQKLHVNCKWNFYGAINIHSRIQSASQIDLTRVQEYLTEHKINTLSLWSWASDHKEHVQGQNLSVCCTSSCGAVSVRVSLLSSEFSSLSCKITEFLNIQITISTL